MRYRHNEAAFETVIDSTRACAPPFVWLRFVLVMPLSMVLLTAISMSACSGDKSGSVEQAWIDGERVVRASVEDVARGLMVTVNGHTVQASVMDERAAAAAAVGPKLTVAAGPTTVRASIPGRVVKILVQVGDVVDDGCPLLVIEAMKMENEIRAPRAGGVAGVAAVVGTAVEAHQDLMTLA